jgi:hypothetical protein
MSIIADYSHYATATSRSPASRNADVSFKDLRIACVWAAVGLLLTMLLAFTLGFDAETLSPLVIVG